MNIFLKIALTCLSFRRASALLCATLIGSLYVPADAQSWGPGYQYDLGWNPSVAADEYDTTIVEVHNGNFYPGTLWYHVGQAGPQVVSWGPSYSYGWGYNPAVAVAFTWVGDVAVEIDSEDSSGTYPLLYRSGLVSGQTIVWSHYNYLAAAGLNPQVAISGNTVIEVHNALPTGGPLMYTVGHVGYTGQTPSVTWGPTYQYDWGFNPSIAITPYNSEIVIAEAHNGSATPGPMWYHVGFWTGGTTVSWHGAYQYDWGWNPKVAFNLAALPNRFTDFPLLAEVHNGNGTGGPMWYNVGEWRGGNAFQWSGASQYDRGYNPVVAIGGTGTSSYAVELHNGWNVAGPLWYHEIVSESCCGPSHRERLPHRASRGALFRTGSTAAPMSIGALLSRLAVR